MYVNQEVERLVALFGARVSSLKLTAKEIWNNILDLGFCGSIDVRNT
jgi:hypothetical protein